jgi:Zn-dependent protease
MDITSLLFIVILIASVILHEVAHGYVAWKLGDPTARLQGRITLNPLAHIDWVGSVLIPVFLVLSGAPFVFGWAKPVPFNPYRMRNPKWGGAIVAFAGPLTNILIAAIAAIVLALFDPSGSLLVYILQGTIITNIALAVFNLLPIPPLDGHHILFALLPDSLHTFKEQLRRISWPLIIIFIIFGWQFISPIIYWIYQWFV